MSNILASIQGLEMKDTDNILQLKWSRKYKQNTYVLSLLKNTKKKLSRNCSYFHIIIETHWFDRKDFLSTLTELEAAV